MVLHNMRLGRQNDHRFEKNMLLHMCYTFVTHWGLLLSVERCANYSTYFKSRFQVDV